MKKIIVLDYNPQWAINFNELKQVYLSRISDLNTEIEHVGSTSVVGLAAKPIIDIDIIADNVNTLKMVIERLSFLGYQHVGDYGIKGREVLKRNDESVPYNEKVKAWPKHNLYVCIKDCDSLQNHLLLRDYLRSNEKARNDYGQLKKNLAEKYKYDIDQYVEAKTSFITNILKLAGMSDDSLNDITDANKAK